LSRPTSKKLANQLIADNLIDKEKLRQVMNREENTGQKLGFILIKLGLIQESQLKDYLTIHMMESLRVALSLKAGAFKLEPIPDAYYERPAYNPTDLMALYRQMIVGEEDLPYLQKEIYSAIDSTEVENLSLLPSGKLPPNPSELLGSRRFSFLLSFLKRRFDRIVIDSAPVIPASDALVLAPQTDGVVILAKGGKVKRELVRKAVEQIKTTKANVIGVVLNQIDFKRDGYYKYYSKYYGNSG
jgi:capsular exopolysaccharide synthesis family protein